VKKPSRDVYYYKEVDNTSDVYYYKVTAQREEFFDHYI
jgi:hypothetical protein